MFPNAGDFDEHDPMSKVVEASSKLMPLVMLSLMDPKSLSNVMLIQSVSRAIEFLEAAKKLAAAKMSSREDDTSAASDISGKV